MVGSRNYFRIRTDSAQARAKPRVAGGGLEEGQVRERLSKLHSQRSIVTIVNSAMVTAVKVQGPLGAARVGEFRQLS